MDELPPADFAPVPIPEDAPENHGLPALSPDTIEQDSSDTMDDIVPGAGFSKLPVVGLGGSAGGLPALKTFFEAMPPDCGMAFVVIMHLSPEHESILAELLQQSTPMPVRQVRDRTRVEANCVYVIPPAKLLSMADGHLRLSEPAARTRSGKHVAVDLFFRTLADSRGAHSVAIVLSGADGDGAVGIKRVKERGGLTIAQDPDEAEQSSMPRTAIATGMVDWVLPAAEIPARLCAYWDTERRMRLPPEQGPNPAAEPAADAKSAAGDEAALHDVLAFVCSHTGRDFTYYKRATILRRISRRMQVNGIEDMPHYLGFLRTHPGETGALLQDLLISVTNFFRDRDAFRALEAAIPALFRHKGPKDTVRVWCAACATGEEAYSVAMLLAEHAGTLDYPPAIQVFATDLDENAIDQARDGTYLETIAADVSEERLRRFFNRGHGKYRVKREVRETVLFALHDLLKDSPFSRLDLITCRNLLIYLNRDAQERALDIFHFSLNPDGKLFLGTSESVDDTSPLFTASDKKYRLYTRHAAARPRLPKVFTGPSAQTQALLRYRQEFLHPSQALSVPPAPVENVIPPEPAHAADVHPATWSEVHARAIEQFGAASVIINAQHNLVHLSGRAGRLLQFNDGEMTTDLLRVVHPMLRLELRAAIFRAEQSGQMVETIGVPVETADVRWAVDLRVVPVVPGAPGFLLVIFTERQFVARANGPKEEGEREPAVRELERELEQSKALLRDTIEQSDASQEELKASNEELQAMNEELRSTSEELETGREELQSINEELSTVNGEMKSRVDELARSNGDLQNLMVATQIATIFLDRQLCIERYTPPAVALFSLIPTDVGRPLSDLTTRLSYPDLETDAQRVLDDLSVTEVEVPHADGRYFLARMRPYRTEDDRISGVVLTFVDITERKCTEQALRESEIRFRAVANLVPDLLWSSEPDGTTTWYNERWLEYTGQSLEEAVGWGWTSVIHPEDQVGSAVRYRAAMGSVQPPEQEHRIRRADGVYRTFLVRAEPLRDERGKVVRWFGSATDIDDLVRARTEATAASEAKDRFLAVLSHELRTPLTPVLLAVHLLSRLPDLPEKALVPLETIRRNVQIEANFIDDLLNLTKVTYGKLEIICEPLDLHEAVRQALEVAAGDLQGKRQPVTVALEATARQVMGDTVRLQQVFWNLLKNASKFTPEGGAIRVASRNEAPGRIVVEISDTGIGFDAEAATRIFDAFAQANAEVTRRFGGLGLGLAIARATLDVHGGTLSARSDGPGQGATFTVDLPLLVPA